MDEVWVGSDWVVSDDEGDWVKGEIFWWFNEMWFDVFVLFNVKIDEDI